MAAPRRSYVFATALVVCGVVTFVVAASLVFLLLDPPLGRTLAAAATILAVVLVPLGLTALLLRGMRRVGEHTTFWENAPGMAGIWAAVVLAVLLLGARGPVAAVLAGLARKHPDAGPSVAFLARTLARWLAPPPPRPEAPERRAGPGPDAGLGADPAPSDLVRATADAATVPGEGRAAPEGETPSPPPRPLAVHLATLPVCASVTRVIAADLGHGPTDELLVLCDDGVHVLWLQDRGVVLERTRFALTAPPSLERGSADLLAADLDRDGRLDLVLCTTWVSERGGTRGGETRWAPSRPNGQFARPRGIAHGACGAVAWGSVTGDADPELLVAESGNPYQPTHPEGVLRWFRRAGAGWAPAGRVPVRRMPHTLRLTDVNRDGFMDVVIEHGWGDAPAVCPGSRQGPLAVDPTLRAPAAPAEAPVVAALDGDPFPDRVSIVAGGAIELYTTTALDPPPRVVTPALDFERFDR